MKLIDCEAIASPNSPIMYGDRETLIRQYLYAHGSCTVHELADLTNASIATLRRDLQRLEEKGVVERTHGGARMVGQAAVEGAFEAREQQNIAAKRAIAGAAFSMLRRNMVVFLDAGTTVLQFARYLRVATLPLCVFTNSLAVGQLLVGQEGMSVTMLGGQLRSPNLSAVGPLAEAMIETLWFDQLFLGASAIQADGTLSTPDPAEASLNARMLGRATRRCVLADSSKFGLTATHRVARLDALTDCVSDAALSPTWQTRLRDAGISVTLAPAGSDLG